MDKLKDPRVIVFSVLVIIVIFGVLNNRQATVPQAPVATSTEVQPEVQPEKQKPVELSGTGKTATQEFSLTDGLKRISMTHDGTSNFIVELLDTEGNSVDGSFVNEIGKFDGSTALKVSEGTYLLKIEADGNWTVTIK
jgi:hypothetical protein